MNDSLSITHLEAERQRRQIDQLARLARSGTALPMPEVRIYMSRGTDINLNGIKISLDFTEVQGDPKTPVLYMSNTEVENKLYALFHDPIVTKIWYDQVFKALKADMEKDNGTVWGYGDTKFCG